MDNNMREKYESLSLSVLRDVAKNRGIKGTSGMRKDAVIEAMLAEDEKNAAAEMVKSQAAENGRTVSDMEQLDSGQTIQGILEVMVLDLSEVTIICREKMMSMYPRLRSAASA